MKKTYLGCLLLGVSCIFLVRPATAQMADTAAELTALLERLDAAVLAGDAETLAAFYAEDFVLVTPIGTTMNKAQMLAPFQRTDRKSPLTAITNEEVTVHRYGSTAVMTMKTTHTFNNDAQTTYRNSLVWVHLDGRWQVVLLQGLRVQG